MDLPPDEAASLAHAREGDRGALGRLLQSHEGRLYNVCLRMVSHPDDAAELTQDALLKAVQHFHGFRGDSRFGTWITRIAMNLAISHLRKRRLRHTASLDANGAGAAAAGLRLAETLPQSREPSAPSRVEQQDDLAQLHRALAELEDDHRAVIVLRDIEQMDYQDIADTLDLPTGTVKSRLFRARLALRERMKPAAAPAR